jgi:hypothetical protein
MKCTDEGAQRMQIIFSFDTEDYVDPVSNDALLRLAEIHTKYDVPACFGVVGEKARFLRTCGRRDVIEAVARHEVGYHSDHHFILPDYDYEQEFVPEYVEKQPWDRTMARLLSEESRGVHDVAEVFGKQPITWLRNFGDWAPQYLCAFAQLGVSIFAYGPPFHNRDCTPIWYCNQLVIANPRLMYENNLHRDDLTPEEKLNEHKRNLLEHLDNGIPRLGFVTHPTRFISDIWWEQPNWMGTVDAPPRRQWKIPPRFSPEKIEELLWIADEFVKFVSQLKDVEPLTFSDFWPKHRVRRKWLSRDEIKQLAAGLTNQVAYQCLGRETYSPAELFAVLAFALAAPEVNDIPLRHIIGPTDEPMETPLGCHVSHQDFLNACQTVEMFLRDKNRVPHVIEAGQIRLGPGGFLLAMAQVIRNPDPEWINIPYASNLPVPLHPDDYEKLNQGTPAAYIQKRGEDERFDFPNTRRMSQLQYWTVKPAVPDQGLGISH